MRVLSLFDGMGGAIQALKESGIKIEKYYASEIDKFAIKIAKKNHPEIIHLGDVTKITPDMVGEIDLLVGGSPCQGFSFAGKQLNFEDERSVLFFEYVRLLKELKPKYFLLENVVMKKQFQDVISEQVGVEPIMINSALLTAQNRKRLYWTNIKGVEQPEDAGVMLRDIVLEKGELRGKKYSWKFNLNPSGKGMNGNVRSYEEEKSIAITTNKGEGQKIYSVVDEHVVGYKKAIELFKSEVERGKIREVALSDKNVKVYYIHGEKVSIGKFDSKDDYLFGVITPNRIKKRQNGQRFSTGKKFYTLTAQDKHGILTRGYIRTLTPVECERLQGFPDGYTEGVSNSQRYKMLGNGFTVPVISYILSHMGGQE